MEALRVLFSSSGRSGRRGFVLGAIAVYAAGVASQLLTTPDVLARAGLWPFAIAQALLIWVWYAVHAKRLRDADRPIGLAVGASLLYALSVILLLIVGAAFFTPDAAMGNASAPSALGLILVLWIIATLAGSPSYDLGWLAVTILMALACLPLIVAVAVTLWAATRPSGKAGA